MGTSAAAENEIQPASSSRSTSVKEIPAEKIQLQTSSINIPAAKSNVHQTPGMKMNNRKRQYSKDRRLLKELNDDIDSQLKEAKLQYYTEQVIFYIFII